MPGGGQSWAPKGDVQKGWDKTSNNNNNDGNSYIKKKTTGNKSFINTKITKGNTNTWWSTILNDITGAPVKNRSFFVNNYERIRSNKSYLPTKQQFSLLTLEKKQDLYQKTRRDIMRSNQNPFGEPEGGGDGNAYQAYLKSDMTAPGFSDGTPPDKIIPNGPTTAEIDQSTATKSADETLLATNKKGRTSNILTNSKGLGDNNLIIKKRKLG